MKAFDYTKLDKIDSACGPVKEGLSDDIGFARVEMINGISPAHYHIKTTEYYLVISGKGITKIKTPQGEVIETELKPGVVLRIDPKEAHQTNNIDSLVLEAITIPAWTAKDEIIIKESLFSE
jgi:mannose-6-phosphate isomerase-like protein (cupin superfamily)